jgi:hypothetical protein
MEGETPLEIIKYFLLTEVCFPGVSFDALFALRQCARSGFFFVLMPNLLNGSYAPNCLRQPTVP